jgi:hypothetical protein
MFPDRSTKLAAIAVAGLLMAWPVGVAARPFIKIGDLQGVVSDGRHRGWTDAISWSPAFPPGQTCTDGWMRCLDRNGHRITVLLHPDRVSPAIQGALKAGARFAEVRIEDYESDGSDYSANTLILSGVQVTEVSVTAADAQGVEAVTLVFDRSSNEASWDESGILGVKAPNPR